MKRHYIRTENGQTSFVIAEKVLNGGPEIRFSFFTGSDQRHLPDSEPTFFDSEFATKLLSQPPSNSLPHLNLDVVAISEGDAATLAVMPDEFAEPMDQLRKAMAAVPPNTESRCNANLRLMNLLVKGYQLFAATQEWTTSVAIFCQKVNDQACASNSSNAIENTHLVLNDGSRTQTPASTRDERMKYPFSSQRPNENGATMNPAS